MLHVTLAVKHGRKDEVLERLFERVCARIVGRLAGEPLDQCAVHAEVELNTHRKEGYAHLTLDLPSGALAAQAKGRSHLAALRAATDALLSELATLRQRRRDRERDAGTIRHGGAAPASRVA